MTRRTNTRRALVVLVALVAWAGPSASAEAPVGWRGDGTGVFRDATPPTAWSTTDNVLWRTPLPAWSNASPAVAGGRVFVTAEPTALLALRAADGAVLWKRDNAFLVTLSGDEKAAAERALREAVVLETRLVEVREQFSRLKRKARGAAGGDVAAALAEAESEVSQLKKRLDETRHMRTPETADIIGYSSSTPVTDGERVYVLMANGVVAAYTADNGERLWVRWLGRSPWMNGNPNGHAASPLLAAGQLIVPYGELQGLDPATGETVWTAGPYADFGTPALAEVGGETLVAAPNGTIVRVPTGEVLTRSAGALFYIGPVVDGERLYYVGGALDASGATRASATAHDLGALLRTGGAADPLWIRSLGRNASYASQVVYEGLIYNLDAARHLQVLDAADGSEVYRRRLSREEVKPSLAIAGGLLFVTDSEGTTFVLRPGRDHEVIRSNVLEPMRASPLFVGRRMYARTFEHLYCVGGP